MTRLPFQECRSLAAFVAFLLAGCGGFGLSATPGTSSLDNGLLSVSPDVLDLGVVASGGERSATFLLANPGSTTVELAKLESSCECLTFKLPSNVIRPGEEVRAAVYFQDDPTDSAEDLLIDVEGRTRERSAAFKIFVKVRVRKNAN